MNMRDAFELVKARDGQLKIFNTVMEMINHGIQQAIEKGTLNTKEVGRLTFAKQSLDKELARISQFSASLGELRKAGDKEEGERAIFYAQTFLDAGHEASILDTARVFLSLGYLIGLGGGSNPVLERQAKERAKTQTQKGRATRLESERPEIEKRRKIALECADFDFRSNPEASVTMHDLATQILPDIDKKCKTAGIRTRKLGAIVTYLKSVPTISERVVKK